jgi:hypothetical protein
MTVPAYLETFRQAVRELQERGKSEISGKSATLIPLNPLIPHPNQNQNVPHTSAKAANNPYAEALLALDRRCPGRVPIERWWQCLDDARAFQQVWGEQAAALGWTADELFGLHKQPANPHPSYSRLSRYDCTGLIWLLQGRHVTVLTDNAAVINTPSGGTLTYRKYGKPAYGPLGDSLDDFIA